MRLTSVVFTVLVSGSLGVLALGAIGCGGGSGSSGSGGSGTGGSTGGGNTGGSTSNACDPVCDAVGTLKSECVAIKDNTGAKKFGLRMAQLTINKPAALTAEKNPIVANIVKKGVTLNLPDCNLDGTGTFSWLLEFDLETGKLKTGGAYPVDDPTAGYCFVNAMLGETQVAPLTVDAPLDANGKFSVEVGGNVVVPIFLTSKDDYVLLPLSNAKIIDATVSPEQNCIGSYDSASLDPGAMCLPPAYKDAATLDAFVTLENADTVEVASLKKTLCALLTGENDGDTTMAKCKRDGNNVITSKGDWCSTTDAAADASCADAFKLGAQFAASAVEITGDCP